MKRLVLMIVPALICGVIFTGCGHVSEAEITDGLWLKMGDNSVVLTSNIDYYDVSQHIIYLKKQVPYLKTVHGTVSVYVGDDEIYECSIHSITCSHFPMGAYTFDIDFEIHIFFNPCDEHLVTDPRNDARIIAALKKYGQYRE